VARVEDEYGGITVIDDKNYRILSFDSIFEQSKMRKNAPALPVHNYIKAMLMAVVLTCVQRVLVLGLGGGSLVRSLHAYNGEITMDVVELRASVVSVAQHYFCLPDSARVHYLVEDAGGFITQESTEAYDLIFSDLYSADAMSPVQSKDSFLAACAEQLSARGWLVMNYHGPLGCHSSFFHALYALFKAGLYCTAPSGNVVIYASKAPIDAPLPQLQLQVKAAGQRFGCDFGPLAQNLAFWPRCF